MFSVERCLSRTCLSFRRCFPERNALSARLLNGRLSSSTTWFLALLGFCTTYTDAQLGSSLFRLRLPNLPLHSLLSQSFTIFSRTYRRWSSPAGFKCSALITRQIRLVTYVVDALLPPTRRGAHEVVDEAEILLDLAAQEVEMPWGAIVPALVSYNTANHNKPHKWRTNPFNYWRIPSALCLMLHIPPTLQIHFHSDRSRSVPLIMISSFALSNQTVSAL